MVAIKRAIEPYKRKEAQERQLNANPSGKKLDSGKIFPKG
jgi:hypothetical protein